MQLRNFPSRFCFKFMVSFSAGVCRGCGRECQGCHYTACCTDIIVPVCDADIPVGDRDPSDGLQRLLRE